MCSFYYRLNNRKKMGPLPLLSVIHTVTIDTMLNFSCGSKGHGLKNVTCKQTFGESVCSDTTMVYLIYYI